MSDLKKRIESCEKCPRLRSYCTKIGKEKKKAHLNEKYWAKPVPGFGSNDPRFFILGLAPAAHGANRTGRTFTGDRSGEWLYRTLYQFNFASAPQSLSLNDRLTLSETYISTTVRCAPPGNKPSKEEHENCLPFLREELALFKKITVFLALGQIAYETLYNVLSINPLEKKPKFKHGLVLKINDTQTLLTSFHPSQQNTFTRKLTAPMFESVFALAHELLQKN
jgi:uracil-DNA glycosylase family 4